MKNPSISESVLTAKWLRQHRLFPISETDKQIELAGCTEISAQLIEEAEFLSGKKIKAVIIRAEELDKRIADSFGTGESVSEILHSQLKIGIPETSDPTHVQLNNQVRILDALLSAAVEKNASDIHLEKFEDKVTVRYRLDGVLVAAQSFPSELYDGVISRIKILSNLDIGEKRLPQDGKFPFETAGRNFDIRVSILPAYFAESCVLRLLDRKRRLSSLESLGFETSDVELMKKYVNQAHGLILINGPTGSGKTTTLYNLLNLIDTKAKKVITIEDPIEYFFDSILQIQTKASIGMDFARGLRAVLRHDPEIILIGEIRDQETAEIALRSALTGHLVLSTVHTNDNASTLIRLIDLGVDKFVIAQSLKLLVTQRLVRRVCTECITEGPDGWYGKGCVVCSNTGYNGREAIYEILEVDENLRELILREDVSRAEIKKYLFERNAVTLDQVGIDKIRRRITTADEIRRVI